jgi:hypothetical protein
MRIYSEHTFAHIHHSRLLQATDGIIPKSLEHSDYTRSFVLEPRFARWSFGWLNSDKRSGNLLLCFNQEVYSVVTENIYCLALLFPSYNDEGSRWWHMRNLESSLACGELHSYRPLGAKFWQGFSRQRQRTTPPSVYCPCQMTTPMLLRQLWTSCWYINAIYTSDLSSWSLEGMRQEGNHKLDSSRRME